jgi:hypothetical protein
VLLLEFDKKITEDIKERERIQEIKDAHKERLKAEKEAQKAEKEAQEALDKEIYYKWVAENNDKINKNVLLLANKINDYAYNNYAYNNYAYNNNNNSVSRDSPILNNNNNNNNYTGKLETSATNDIEVYNTDTQFNNEASQIISDDKNSETTNDINLKETAKKIHKLAIEENNTNFINEYISLYNKVNGDEPNNDTIKRYSKPSANSSLVIMINALKKTISEEPERVILVNKYKDLHQKHYGTDVDENFIYNVMRESNGKKTLEDKISYIEKMRDKIRMKEISALNNLHKTNLKTTKIINNAWDSTAKAFSKLSSKPKSLTKRKDDNEDEKENNK